MPIVRISNMYDMSTTIKKMGIIGVHTPSRESIYRKYGGLYQNYKFMRVLSCDVKIACASMLPADPLQIGVEAGKISPADMMNPILYRAVTNDSWNTVINRIYATSGGQTADTIRAFDNAWGSTAVTDTQALNVYYALLSDDGWRKALPQAGLSMGGLKPLVYQVVNNFGNMGAVGVGQGTAPNGGNTVASLDNGMATAPGGSSTNVSNLCATFRGHAMPMPRIPCMATESAAYNNVPKTFVACIVMPPADLTVMYYRLIVSWTIEFSDLCPMTDWKPLSAIADIGDAAHYSTWSVSSSKALEPLDKDDEVSEIGFVDAMNMAPELVMEK